MGGKHQSVKRRKRKLDKNEKKIKFGQAPDRNGAENGRSETKKRERMAKPLSNKTNNYCLAPKKVGSFKVISKYTTKQIEIFLLSLNGSNGAAEPRPILFWQCNYHDLVYGRYHQNGKLYKLFLSIVLFYFGKYWMQLSSFQQSFASRQIMIMINNIWWIELMMNDESYMRRLRVNVNRCRCSLSLFSLAA